MKSLSRSFAPALLLSCTSLLACQKEAPPSAKQEREGTPSAPVAAAVPLGASSPTAAAPSAEDVAEVGKPAPDFTLKDLEGKSVQLSSFQGKRVVLEWFNPECPFIRAAHGKGSLKDQAARLARRGVVWLAINSNAPGKQGHGIEKNRSGAEELGISHPVLLDESGEIGKKYGAERTPHVFLIDEKGVLVYQGAIDNSPDGEGKEPEGGQLINYVDRALGELDAGKPVSSPVTKSYGCTVKYGS